MKYRQDEAEQLLLSHQSVDVKTLCGDEVSSSKRCSSILLRGVRGLLVQIRELLEDGGDIRHPLPDLGGGAAPGARAAGASSFGSSSTAGAGAEAGRLLL